MLRVFFFYLDDVSGKLEEVATYFAPFVRQIFLARSDQQDFPRLTAVVAGVTRACQPSKQHRGQQVGPIAVPLASSLTPELGRSGAA